MSILVDNIDEQLTNISIKPRVRFINKMFTTRTHAESTRLLLENELSTIPIEEVSEKTISTVINKCIRASRTVRAYKFAHGEDKAKITSDTNAYVYIYRPSKYIPPSGFIISFI